MNKHDELDLAILSVLLKSHSGADKYRRDHQLKLALMWNRVDIAREEIFREDVLWEQGRCSSNQVPSSVPKTEQNNVSGTLFDKLKILLDILLVFKTHIM